ncbi:hypothetical protein ALMP_57480 [Streptomyces sp. A012304]|nr:hypothetical protein ALMP_57480 [Streptomyces sp. A012304]
MYVVAAAAEPASGIPASEASTPAAGPPSTCLRLAKPVMSELTSVESEQEIFLARRCAYARGRPRAAPGSG